MSRLQGSQDACWTFEEFHDSEDDNGNTSTSSGSTSESSFSYTSSAEAEDYVPNPSSPAPPEQLTHDELGVPNPSLPPTPEGYPDEEDFAHEPPAKCQRREAREEDLDLWIDFHKKNCSFVGESGRGDWWLRLLLEK